MLDCSKKSYPSQWAAERALQAIQDPYAYRLPNFDDHQEIASGGYALKCWIKDYDQEWGLDRHDPWADCCRPIADVPPQYDSRDRAAVLERDKRGGIGAG